MLSKGQGQSEGFLQLHRAMKADDRHLYKICKGYWFFGRPTLQDLCPDLRTCCNAALPVEVEEE
jgi:hypothetical protein